MATKQQWREYFKLMNDREPSLEDFQRAVENGEIDDGSLDSSVQQTLSNESHPFDSQAQIPATPQQYSPVRPLLSRTENTAQRTSDHYTKIFESYKLFWKNYVNFSGRSRRSEFWWTYLVNSVISFIILIPGLIVLFGSIAYLGHSGYDSYGYDYGYSYSDSIAGIIGGTFLAIVPPILFGLAIIIPGLALFFRRIRDTGLSTMNAVALIVFGVVLMILVNIPILGILAGLAALALEVYIIVLLAQPSDHFQNRSEPITDWFARLFKK
jgi:uncharacterized membrane protein YhaH (DUF805 family)